MRPLAVTLALALAACGDEAPRAVSGATPAATPAAALTDAERARTRRYEGRIQAHCVAVARSLVDPGAAPTASEQARAFAAADHLVALVRAKPGAERDVGQDLRLYLGDVIENLEGANCDPRLRERLERGLASIPRTTGGGG